MATLAVVLTSALLKTPRRLALARNEEPPTMEENPRRTARRSPRRRSHTTSCLFHKDVLRVRLTDDDVALILLMEGVTVKVHKLMSLLSFSFCSAIAHLTCSPE